MESQNSLKESPNLTSYSSPVDVIQQSHIAVLQDSSEIVHWPQNEDALFHTISTVIPWLDPVFFDEYSLDAFFTGIEKQCFSALLISSSAMASMIIRNQLDSHADSIHLALVSGMGISISAPYLTDIKEYVPQFLGTQKAISLRNGGKTLLHKGKLRVFHDDAHRIPIDAELNSLLSTRVSCSADILPGWIANTELIDEENSSMLNLGWSSKEGLGIIQVSVLPLERLDDPTSFYKSLVNLTRAHGIGVYRAENDISCPWSMERRPVNYLIKPLSTVSLEEISRLADVIRYVPSINTFQGFDENALRKHVERGGSFECRFEFPDETPCQVSIGGIPDYLAILRAVEARVDSQSESLATGPTFALVAYSFCAFIARLVVKESSLVPTPFRQAASAAIARKSVEARIFNGSVDMRLLPTLNVLASAWLSGIPDQSQELEDIYHWVKSSLLSWQDETELEQVRWILQLLTVLMPSSTSTKELLDLTHQISSPKSMVGRLSRFLDIPEDDRIVKESSALHFSLQKSMAVFSDQIQSLKSKHKALIEESDSNLIGSFVGTESDYYLVASTILAKRTEVFYAGESIKSDLESYGTELNRDQQHLVEAMGRQQDLENALADKKQQVAIQAKDINMYRTWSRVLLTCFVFILALLDAALVFVIVKNLFPGAALSDWATAGSIGFATWVLLVTAISFIPGAIIVLPNRLRRFTKRDWTVEDSNENNRVPYTRKVS